jgi:hypothetical protein
MSFLSCFSVFLRGELYLGAPTRCKEYDGAAVQVPNKTRRRHVVSGSRADRLLSGEAGVRETEGEDMCRSSAVGCPANGECRADSRSASQNLFPLTAGESVLVRKVPHVISSARFL